MPPLPAPSRIKLFFRIRENFLREIDQVKHQLLSHENLEGIEAVELSMGQTAPLSSFALSELLSLYIRLKQAGVPLELTDVTPGARVILCHSGLDRLIRIHGSPNETPVLGNETKTPA